MAELTLTWKKMINFDQPKGNGTAFSYGVIIGWVYYLVKLLDLNTLGWEFIIKGICGLAFSVASGFLIKLTNTYFEERIKPKLFKDKRNGKSNKRAA